jgi:hypothetical protein
MTARVFCFVTPPVSEISQNTARGCQRNSPSVFGPTVAAVFVGERSL